MKKSILILLLVSHSWSYSLLTLTSPAFRQYGIIPEKYTCDGDNVSPHLNWTGAPKNSKSFALIVQDPDTGEKPFVHWIIFNIPPFINHLVENSVTGQFTSGATDFHGSENYGGPCPPKNSKHRYTFTVYALDIMPSEYPRAKPDLLQSGANKDTLMKVMHNHILESATLTGYYTRK